MITARERLETERITHAIDTSDLHKEAFGQYFTPYPIAQFMASFFPVTNNDVHLLDPGAGIGVLTCAFLERIKNEKWDVPNIDITAYDIDSTVCDTLRENISYAAYSFENVNIEILNTDFLDKTSFDFTWNIHKKYTHVIMNPPYKKIKACSKEREETRAFGLETVNLYSAFLGASIALTEKSGYIVAVIPRSFCNGAYYKPFRQFILKNCSIKHIHLFESRNQAFKDESVLQENIIIMLQKETAQENVTVTYSENATFKNMETLSVPFTQILNPKDKEAYFSIPTQIKDDEFINNSFTSLKQLGIQVSTGPLVDFRLKYFLYKEYAEELVPLVYPVHLRNYKFEWPKKSKKPNAVAPIEEVRKQLFPKGYYVLVKRFSTKEEKQRVVASLITPEDFVKDTIAFENHLNVFHVNKSGLPEELAYGLIVWLNTSYIDEKFRLFSGHTQVNATDLRNLPYPPVKTLTEMGKELKTISLWDQKQFDIIVKGSVE
jgi:adenine-specific DNA-methyltransferase